MSDTPDLPPSMEFAEPVEIAYQSTPDGPPLASPTYPPTVSARPVAPTIEEV